MPDITAFRVVFTLGLSSYILLIFFSDYTMLSYCAIVGLVTSIGGWNNVFLFIMEMRVPPNNVAAVAIIIRTLAVGSGVMAATVAAQKTYVAYIILCGIAITGFLASLWLPQPG